MQPLNTVLAQRVLTEPRRFYLSQQNFLEIVASWIQLSEATATQDKLRSAKSASINLCCPHCKTADMAPGGVLIQRLQLIWGNISGLYEQGSIPKRGCANIQLCLKEKRV